MLSKKIKELRKSKNLTQKQLAEKLFVDQTAVSYWEQGKTMPDSANQLKIANIFGVSLDYLFGRIDNPSTKTFNKQQKKGVKIPVLGRVAAGIPLEAIEDIIDYEEIDEDMAKRGDFFALEIKGRSMEPRMKEGDVVIVRNQPDVESGEIAIVLINGQDATCKKFVKHENGISLVSFNNMYEPMFFTWEEVYSLPVSIIGKVVELRGKF